MVETNILTTKLKCISTIVEGFYLLLTSDTFKNCNRIFSQDVKGCKSKIETPLKSISFHPRISKDYGDA